MVDTLSVFLHFLETNPVARLIESEHSRKIAFMTRGDSDFAELDRIDARLRVYREKYPVTYAKFFRLWRSC